MLTSSLLEGLTISTRLNETEQSFTAVSTDTRTIVAGALFVPLKGERFNGHDYVDAAIKSGAQAALWEEGQPVPADLPDDFQLYVVKDTLFTLQEMASAYRVKINPKVIGITGSNGKTTTKDILASLLSLEGETYKTQGNYNNHIGLPLTILAMPSTCKYLILEMGMSGYGEIERLSEIAKPDLAIVTNIGESHMEQLGSRAGIAKAKMEIKEGLSPAGFLFIDSDEPLLDGWKQSSIIRVGFNHADILVENVAATVDGYRFDMEGHHFELSLLGKHNVKNAAYCIAVAHKFGLSTSKIQTGLRQISLTSMRLEKLTGSKGELIVNDAYNASPTSMIAAIDALKAIPSYEKRVVVLGDMFELGTEEEALHKSVAQVITPPITHVLTLGDRAKWIYEEASHISSSSTFDEIAHFTTKQELADHLSKLVDQKTVILFKASRGMKLEEVITAYQDKQQD
ncbi:UDP-N-acetylmuramoyl-tripeptide--D-alanyl-D-alanine ligase [Alkalihalophilus marmarensis]|jgi:UDP-N-acetylmuramoyl-tripeptide--D-alanyl-D-alanine ligase|uniref:UDP-N-acetylmuramoyl-tripeptide--D-alanyl-D-alanine ligase n=1 Tax=Alkalihalophilus marmarensis DSM 21297 TaxID=1188261 RepID=U6SPC8_9BACI|nr:UDP-N-acetylmuramoyl-tripeptide--D-alanyl-D-alanine ligase [Alkalihalophilus marmarensis]ERN53237.1 UDP-N-acetylmuramoylalanyl-D-glutamate--2,6-diaminopimelate ligase [Alkalihalophilus marmarensis DSM 21297]MCM3489682.1 UDP-N-acetylmuramoyl-tripeptide--D-alanyl-D-alanine ligase [Alkalihalophilus marmarensis]